MAWFTIQSRKSWKYLLNSFAIWSLSWIFYWQVMAPNSSVAERFRRFGDRDKKNATRKDGTQGCKVYFKVDVKRSQMKNRMEGVDKRNPSRSAITTWTTGRLMKNSSLCDLPQEVDDEHKGKLNLMQIKKKERETITNVKIRARK